MSVDARALLATYWGKADPAQALVGSSHHTVLGHSLDVAACAFVLVTSNPVLLEQIRRSSGLGATACAPTLAAFVAIHDLGKLDTRFQRKAPEVADRLRPHSSSVPRAPYDHGTEGFRLIEDDEVGTDFIQRRFGSSAVPLLRAVCGHHGDLPTCDAAAPRAHLPRDLRKEDQEARFAFLQIIADFFGNIGAMLPWNANISGPSIQRVAGLCAITDWLGSNTEYFPYATGALDPAEYWPQALERANRACAESGLIRARTGFRAFSDLFPGYRPRDVQILTERVACDVPALVIVEAEMGKGKTEAALSLAARFMATGVSDGLTVGLPTMATSNAMFERVEQFVPRLFERQNAQLTLAHGRARRSAPLRALVARGMVAQDADAPEATVSCARWLLGRKRVLLAQIGVGTVDQALQAALLVRHQFVRLFGLSRNVVVIDEVHAYDAYMEVLLEHLLAWLGALQVPVILLSATLPSDRRHALAQAWRSGSAQGSGETSLDSPEQATSTPYPLVTVATRLITETLHAPSETTRTILVRRQARAGHDLANAIAVVQQLIHKAAAGGRVAWIRNTVAEAQLAFEAIEALAPDIERSLFHARMRGCDRSEVEAVVLERFGKTAPPGGRILIATQVVEQSLDLDFDELHTDLAPVDLLFQRAGRLHRHPRERLPEFVRPCLVVHTPSSEEIDALRLGPSSYVYDAATLWLADRMLRERDSFEFPHDIRPLVERTYHPVLRSEGLASSARLLELEAKRQNEVEARRTRAKRCCIQAASAEYDGAEGLSDDDETVQAFTRDGTSVTLLPFHWVGGQALTMYADEGESAWQLDPSSQRAWQQAGDLLDQTLSLSARRTARGVLDRDEHDAFGRWLARFRTFAEATGLGDRVVPVPFEKRGDAYEGWLALDGKKEKRVIYTKKKGLSMPRAEELER